MRMRRKKNLASRLDACKSCLILPPMGELNANLAPNGKEYLDFFSLFGNHNPLYLEIGCGRGQFACQSALSFPQINFIAVEKISNVIVEAGERAMALGGIPNLVFFNSGAEYLNRYLPPHSVKRIFLNFSCPYPKTTYQNRRLTNPRFLNLYKELLIPGGEIHQKTDNQAFFEYSLESFSACGYRLKNISLDLHHSGFEGNIPTEYEEKFSAMGKPIYRLEAVCGEKKEEAAGAQTAPLNRQSHTCFNGGEKR